MCEHGYPGPRPLYVYDVLRKRQTFGTSGFPLCSPPARKEWEYPDGLCPVAEAVCPLTICCHWSERYESEHVALIAAAITKVPSFTVHCLSLCCQCLSLSLHRSAVTKVLDQYRR